MNLPFVSCETKNGFIRTFFSDTCSSSLVWHRDKQDRTVTVLNGEGWFFQFEDQLPFELKKGMTFFIENNTFHRILKAEDSTNIEVEVVFS